MSGLFQAFFVWCCQFVVVSTVFLTTSYWLLGRSRRRKQTRNQSRICSAMTSQEEQHVAHGA